MLAANDVLGFDHDSIVEPNRELVVCAYRHQDELRVEDGHDPTAKRPCKELLHAAGNDNDRHEIGRPKPVDLVLMWELREPFRMALS